MGHDGTTAVQETGQGAEGIVFGHPEGQEHWWHGLRSWEGLAGMQCQHHMVMEERGCYFNKMESGP